MLDESYHLYKLKRSAVVWDGLEVTRLDGLVGAQAGFSVVDVLKRLNVPTESSVKAPDGILAMLQRGRLGAAALQTSQGDFELGRKPALAAAIERVGPALVSQPYYLMLSHALVERDAALAERIWDAVAAVRESPDYRAALQAARGASAP
jgi:polar amino acid transport system substrate-binding protein